jgi:hypothetical protein
MISKVSQLRGVRTYIRVIVLAEYVKHSPVDNGLDIVELVDICMLDPVHQHLATDHYQEWRQYLTREQPRG